MKPQYTDIEPSDRRFLISQARSLFLNAIRENAYEVLKELSEFIFSSPSINGVKSVILKDWANRWNLNADWILEVAIETNFSWQQIPLSAEDSIEFSVSDIWKRRNDLTIPADVMEILEARREVNGSKIRFSESSFLATQFIEAKIPFKFERNLFWSFLSVGWKVNLKELERIEPPIGLPGWEADAEPRAFYLQRVKERIEKELKEGFFSDVSHTARLSVKNAKLKIAEKYCNDVVKAYQDLKDANDEPLWIPTQEKENLKRNAVWAVRFQVLGEEFQDIAKEDGFDRSTVQKASDEFIDLIGLKRLEKPRGRPKGRKDSVWAMRNYLQDAKKSRVKKLTEN